MVFLQCSYYREEKVIHKPKTRKVIKGERLKKKKICIFRFLGVPKTVKSNQ